MTMYGMFLPKSEVDIVHEEKRERGRGLMGMERRIREEENSSDFYVFISEENLISLVAAAETLNYENIVIFENT